MVKSHHARGRTPDARVQINTQRRRKGLLKSPQVCHTKRTEKLAWYFVAELRLIGDFQQPTCGGVQYGRRRRLVWTKGGYWAERSGWFLMRRQQHQHQQESEVWHNPVRRNRPPATTVLGPTVGTAEANIGVSCDGVVRPTSRSVPVCMVLHV